MGHDLKGKKLDTGEDQLPSKLYRWRYRGPEGQRLFITNRTLAGLRLQKNAIISDLVTGDWIDPARSEISLDAWFKIWITGHKGKPSTVHGYAQDYRLYVKPYLGKESLRALNSFKIDRWLGALDKDGKSQSAKKRGHKVLSAALGMRGAMGDERIRRNPCASVTVAAPQEQAWTLISLAEFDRLLECVPEYYQPMVLLMWVMALRFGEVTALRRRDVDLLHKVVSVEEGTYLVQAEPDYDLPRHRATDTPKSNRTRVISYIPERALRVLQAQLELPGGPDDLLFPAPRQRGDGYIEHGNWTNRVWRPACQKAGLDGLRAHDLRHSAASWLRKQGVEIEVLQHLLGHADSGTTKKYIHFDGADVRAGLQMAYGEADVA